jgi:hypothetical protein
MKVRGNNGHATNCSSSDADRSRSHSVLKHGAVTTCSLCISCLLVAALLLKHILLYTYYTVTNHIAEVQAGEQVNYKLASHTYLCKSTKGTP